MCHNIPECYFQTKIHFSSGESERTSVIMCNNTVTLERAKHIVHCTCRRTGRSLGNRYMGGYGPIWLDDLQCTGSETQLGNCRHRGWGYHNCRHYEDVSIACIGDSSQRGSYIVSLQIICQQHRRIHARFSLRGLTLFFSSKADELFRHRFQYRGYPPKLITCTLPTQ